MRIGKLFLATLLGAIAPAVANAQVNVGVNVDIDAGAYDTTAPGDPVESVDVFYDQLQPYGVWVDEPDFGRVFIPQEDNFVPYTTGHWEYTRLGFVWVSSEPHAWATSHYGRWAYSSPYSRWVWTPDTQWGPAWVDWRQTNDDFGWAPLPPVNVAASYSPPIESWHYCGANHILDVHVTNYYEPRARVVEIHREARPMQHYSTVSNVKVVVGPPPSVLRDHRIEVKPVRVEQRTIGRWSPTEAHAQVARAQEHKATFEVANQKRVEANTHIRAAQTKVIETHPQLKVQIDARNHAQPNRVEPNKPNEPARPGEPMRTGPSHPNAGQPNRVEPSKPAEPVRPAPQRVEPNRPAEPVRPAPQHVEPRPAEPVRPAPQHVEPKPAEPVRPAPQHVEPKPAEPARPAPQQHVEPNRPAEPARPAPAPQHSEPARPAPAQHAEPAHPAPAEHEHKEPEKK